MLSVFQCLLLSHASAEQRVHTVDLRGQLTSLEDVEGAMSPESVWRRIRSDAGTRELKSNLDYGVTESTYWIQVPLASLDLGQSDDWVLEVAFPRLRDVQFFSFSDSGEILNHAHITLNTPLLDRPAYGRTYLFPFDNVPNLSAILIRVQSTIPMQIPLFLRTASAARKSQLHRDLALGIYFGLALMMALYNLVIFVFTREKIHLLYSAQVFSFVLLIFLTQGFGYYVFPDSWSVAYEKGVPLGSFFPGIFLCLFIISFFDLKNADPPMYRLLVILQAVLCGWVCIYLWLNASLQSLSSSILAVMLVLTLLVITGRRILASQAGARLLFAAWLAFLGGVLVFFLNRLGILPRNIFTEYSMLLGSALEITMLSLAIPHRMQQLRREQEAVVDTLATVTQDLSRETQKREDLSTEVSSLKNRIDDSKSALDSLREELGTSENQLIQAEKMASVGQLVASVTHDIANPTTHILVSQSAMNEKIEKILNAEPGEYDEEKVKSELNSILRYAKFIRTGAMTIADIHRSFAYYSRADAEMRPSVDIEKVLKDAMMILTTRVQPHILTTVFLECPRISCRPSEICQMVANLVSNAADAMSGIGVTEEFERAESSSGKISLRLSPLVREEHEGIIVEVHDSGPGISSKAQETMFKPFVTTKQAGEGTGLGLAITQRIIERHQGHIEVKTSQELGGALFRVWLPVKQLDIYESN